ncbi:hypothetical protein CEK25_003447 [Fusarium fujikuroi]|nr:hypothetical protein CEK25_003447 [Fusarium fujikuroi]
MSNHTKVVDGVVVTNTDFPPPRDWTNVYDEIGGDMRWNDDLEEMIKDRGLDGDVQPFYGTCSYTGEALFLMQVGGKQFLFWNALDDSIMSQYTTVSDGVVVTDNGIPPPENWVNSYESIGGDMLWGQGGQIEDEVRGRGIDGDIRPHYGMAPYTGEALYLFEVGSGKFFFYNAIDGSMLQIKDQSDLKSIVDILDDENRGLPAIDMEEV